MAHGGAIFLDELELLPVHAQTQLLRVLQSRQVLRVGGRKMIPVDARVIAAATNINLEDAVAGGTFRQDLYYRVNVLHVDIPPLRERPEDLALLIAHYPPILNHNSHNISGLSPALLSEFKNYSWPGNIRELLNYLTRMVVFSPGPELTLGDLRLSGVKLKAVKKESAPEPLPPEQ